MPAGSHGVGARLPRIARCVCAAALPPGPSGARLPADPGRRRRAFRRRRHHRGRPAGGRRRHPLHHSPAMPAAALPALCRLCGVARAHSGGGIPADDPPRAVQLHDLLPAARRAVSGLSGGWPGQRSARRAIAATTWSGTGRPTNPPSSSSCSPTSTARRTSSRSRRRSSAPRRSRKCGRPPSGFWPRSSAPSCV